MSNPLANETIITKIKKKNKVEEAKPYYVRAELLGMNDAMRICAEACACCWDKEIPTEYDAIAEYVAKRSRIGHTSVLEHSNFVIYVDTSGLSKELIEFLDCVKYLNTKIIAEDNRTRMIIGGSLRGFCDIYREISDLNNPILQAISGILYMYSNSAAFEDICKEGLMDKTKFMNIEPDVNCMLLSTFNEVQDFDKFTAINVDSIKTLYTNIYEHDMDMASKLTTYDLIKFVTLTILFKDMSRTATHQLVRHRNAITQESQRYVDYSQSCFSSPEMYKPDKYDGEHKYKIRFGPSSQMNLTLSEIGKAICDLYGMLSNPVLTGAEYHLLKEDARAFLPGNVQCKKIYMTFTYKSFFKFLQLREDKAAQAEIRSFAVAVGDWFRSISEFNTKELCDLYTKPRLCLGEDPHKIDIDEGIVEENIQLTEEDYIHAAGLDVEDDTDNEDRPHSGLISEE